MKRIYILLMHTNTIPARFVKLMTRYKYSHVAISLEKSCDITYSFGRRNVNSFLNGGFSIQHKDGEFFRKFNNTECKIYEIEIEDKKYEAVKDILSNMEDNINNYKYDFLGIVLRYLYIPFVHKNRYVCSYFVAYVLEKTNIHKFNKKIYFVKPKDFENIEEFKEIYVGLYNTYK